MDLSDSEVGLSSRSVDIFSLGLLNSTERRKLYPGELGAILLRIEAFVVKCRGDGIVSQLSVC